MARRQGARHYSLRGRGSAAYRHVLRVRDVGRLEGGGGANPAHQGAWAKHGHCKAKPEITSLVRLNCALRETKSARSRFPCCAQTLLRLTSIPMALIDRCVGVGNPPPISAAQRHHAIPSARPCVQLFKVLKKNLPGPYTFILPASSELPKLFFIDGKVGAVLPPRFLLLPL